MLDFIKPPKIGRLFYKDLIFKIPNKENKIFLTFDDGPNPEVTPFILETLSKFNAKATFFCLGKQVEKHPTLFDQIISEGHQVGNHGYDHFNGWETKTEEYINNVIKASELIDSKLFRPPYGKMKVSQIKILKENYKLVLWDVSAQDYLPNITADKVVSNVENHTTEGSIIVMHDNGKVKPHLKNSLPAIVSTLVDRFNMSFV